MAGALPPPVDLHADVDDTRQRVRVLLLENDDDDHAIFAHLASNIDDLDVDVVWCRTLHAASERFASESFDVVFVDLHLDDGDSGHSFIDQHAGQRSPLVMLTAHGTPQDDLDAMRSGADNFIAKDRLDVERLRRTLLHAMARHEQLLRLQEASERDALTGLCNRRALDRWFAAAASREGRASVIIGALVVDLDDFKPINDTLGHAAGDHVLCTAAERLLQSVRTTDMVARTGGDEFVVLLEENADNPNLDVVRDRVRMAIEDDILLPSLQQSCRVGASIGAALRAPGEDLEQLLHRADADMYRVKSERKAQAS